MYVTPISLDREAGLIVCVCFASLCVFLTLLCVCLLTVLFVTVLVCVV